jgi:restriction endonuclease S subunit
MQSQYFENIKEEITIGSTQNAITIDTIGQKYIVLTPDEIIKQFSEYSRKLIDKENV